MEPIKLTEKEASKVAGGGYFPIAVYRCNRPGCNEEITFALCDDSEAEWRSAREYTEACACGGKMVYAGCR